MKDDSKRCTNIELVRILFMLGIIIMHYLNPKMGGYLTYIQSNGKQADVALTYFMISISACAVNLFVLINGYFMCESYQRTVTKPVKLILQVIIFQTLPSIAGMFLGFHEFSVRGFIRTLVPANWYVILYIALYWISPYINIIIDVLDKKELLKFIYVVFAIFSIYPTVVDVLSEIIGHEIHGLSSVGMYGSQWGYSIVNFVLMYLIGAYIKRANIEKSPHYTGGGVFTLLLLINTLFLTCWAFFNDQTGYINERSAWEYCNPFIILETILVFGIFIKIRIVSKFISDRINSFAKGVFSVYLLHSQFFRFIPSEWLITSNGILLWGQLILISIGIFLICYFVFRMYEIIMKPVYNILNTLFANRVLTVSKPCSEK